MEVGTCIRYLNFIADECDKMLADRKVTANELVQLITEMQLFKDRIFASELSYEIKSKILKLKIDYSIDRIERMEKYRIISYIVFSSFPMINEKKMMEDRIQTVSIIRHDCCKLAFYIKTHFSE